jgi:tRNA(fMet)-specific endonuclease VapC
LDTDVLSLIQQESQPAYGRLAARLRRHPPETIAATIISFQEQVLGWLSFLNRSRRQEHLLLAYAKLDGIRRYYSLANVLPFDEAALGHFISLKRQEIRLGTMDLRIASIALATGSVLVSRNLRDFRRVPNLVVEDWTAE